MSSTNGNHRDDPWTIPERDPERDLDALDRAWGRNYSEPSPPPNYRRHNRSGEWASSERAAALAEVDARIDRLR